MTLLIGCMVGHRAEVGVEHADGFAAADSPPCGECGMPTFVIGDTRPIEEIIEEH